MQSRRAEWLGLLSALGASCCPLNDVDQCSAAVLPEVEVEGLESGPAITQPWMLPDTDAFGASLGPHVDLVLTDDAGCGLRQSGTLQCWRGLVRELDDVVAVDASPRTTCALQRSGMVHCWGFDEPVLGPFSSPWVELVVGDGVACGVDGSGQFSCEGAELDGLGEIAVLDVGAPTDLCALDAQGRLSCTFEDQLEQPIDADQAYSSILVAGQRGGVCVVRADNGDVRCLDAEGPALNFDITLSSLSFAVHLVHAPAPALSLHDTLCGLSDVGKIRCTDPRLSLDGSGWVAVGVAAGEVCGVDSAGEIRCDR